MGESDGLIRSLFEAIECGAVSSMVAKIYCRCLESCDIKPVDEVIIKMRSKTYLRMIKQMAVNRRMASKVKAKSQDQASAKVKRAIAALANAERVLADARKALGG